MNSKQLLDLQKLHDAYSITLTFLGVNVDFAHIYDKIALILETEFAGEFLKLVGLLPRGREG